MGVREECGWAEVCEGKARYNRRGKPGVLDVDVVGVCNDDVLKRVWLGLSIRGVVDAVGALRKAVGEMCWGRRRRVCNRRVRADVGGDVGVLEKGVAEVRWGRIWV